MPAPQPALHDYQQELAALHEELRALQNSVGDKAMSDDQQTTWDEKMTRASELRSAMAREHALQAEAQRMAEQTPPKPMTEAPMDEQTQYRSAFSDYLRSGTTGVSDEARALLQEHRAQSTSVPEKGGYTVPREMRNKITEVMKAYGGIALLSNVMTTESGHPLHWPVSDGTQDMGVIVGENQETKTGEVLFSEVSLNAYRLSSQIIKISEELLQDSGVDIEDFLARRIGERLGRGQAHLLINGTGNQQPKGLLKAIQQVQTGHINADSLLTLKHTVDMAYRSSAHCAFAFNDMTFKSISALKDKNGRPLWLPEISHQAPASIYGVRYVIDNGIPDGTVMMGDFNRFVIRHVHALPMKRLVERFAENGQVGFIACQRFDCVLEDTRAFALLKPEPKKS